MPQEPDNTKMEELLKAYAKKRREASGNPLHPATRRMLQAEVARVYPKRDHPEVIPWYKLLLQFWPRVAFAVGLVVLLGSVFWALNRPPADSRNLSLARNEVEAAKAAPRENLGFRDAEKLPISPQNPSAMRGLSLAESSPPPATPPPMTRSAPRPTLSPRATAPKLVAENEVALSEELSREARSEKRNAGAAPPRPAASETADRFYKSAATVATAPLPAPTAPPPAREPEALGMDNRPARGPVSLSIASEPTIRRESKQLASGAAVPLADAKRVDDLAAVKEDVASLEKKAAEMETRAGVSGSFARALPAQASSFSLDTTTWTNIASGNQQSWFYQSHYAFGGGDATAGAVVPAPQVSSDPNTRQLGESDKDFPGSFGNVGGDGRFARSKAQVDRAARGRIVPTASPAPVERSADAADKLGIAGTTIQPPENNTTLTYRYFSDAVTPLYSQKSLPALNAPAPAPLQPASPRVLDSFQLIQSGDSIQFVDADGSVYEGKLQTVQNPVRNLEGVELQPAPAAPVAPVAQQFDTLGRQSETAAVATNSFLFKASGLNRTLGQTVLINGRLDRQPVVNSRQDFGAVRAQAPVQNAPRGAETLAVNALADSPVAANPSTATNAVLRISGTATIGGTNQIRLEAIPARR